MPLERFFARAAARVRLQRVLHGLAAGAAAAAVALGVLRASGTAVAVQAVLSITAFAIGAGLTYAAGRRHRGPLVAAALVERADPSLRNLLITARQLMLDPGPTPAYMRDRVLADASRRAGRVDLRAAISIGRAALGLAAAASAIVISAMIPAVRAERGAPHAGTVSRGAPSARVDLVIEIDPPEYSRRPPLRLVNPASVAALAGSRGAVRLSGVPRFRVRLNGETIAADAVARMEFKESGFIAIDAEGVDRLVPLTVIPDAAPEVRIRAPGKDLRVASVSSAIHIAADATDDLALRAFELRYTVVSGTGEQFSFTEGTLPAALTRESDRRWRLDTELSLVKLRLEPGDALIYRAVAADARPGDAGIGSSDTFFVEIAGPGDVPLEGVEMPPDKERYALSQAMIVLKIERLRAREKGLAKPALEDAAGTIAAEQRAVRANFVFLLGGEVEDEEAEAEASHEITEGRFANQARREIVAATLLMSRVERALSALSTGDALPPARDAVKALQRAFGHSRYLLRALPSRARIDPARRLSGDLSTARDWSRALAPPAGDPQAEATRLALADLVAVSALVGDPSRRDEASRRLTAIAERALSAGAAAGLQDAARDAMAARSALAAGDVAAARVALQRASAPLIQAAQRGRIEGAIPRPGAARLTGAAAVGRQKGGQ